MAKNNSSLQAGTKRPALVTHGLYQFYPVQFV